MILNDFGSLGTKVPIRILYDSILIPILKLVFDPPSLFIYLWTELSLASMFSRDFIIREVKVI